MAEPGEFTLRAFLSGRIDLTQAEAVLGVIDTADPKELQVALAQLAGGLAGPLHHLRESLVELLAHLEAGFDFADEDLPFITAEQLHSKLDEAAEQVDQLTLRMESRGSVQTAVSAVLLGQPNTGKSSLFNAIIRMERALVSDRPGTTRDYLVAELDFDGNKCQLIDTAGFHAEAAQKADSAIAPDSAAQQAAAEQIAHAQIRLLCLDATRPLNIWEKCELDQSKDIPQIVIWTKLDALQKDSKSEYLFRMMAKSIIKQPVVLTSNSTGEGIDLLRLELKKLLLGLNMTRSDVVASTAARCHESLYHAGKCLRNALNLIREKSGEELVATEILMAINELGKVVGTVYTDDVLDHIFSRFCVGK